MTTRKRPSYILHNLLFNEDVWKLVARDLNAIQKFNLSMTCKETSKYIKITQKKGDPLTLAFLRRETIPPSHLSKGVSSTDNIQMITHTTRVEYFRVQSIKFVKTVNSFKIGAQQRFEIRIKPSLKLNGFLDCFSEDTSISTIYLETRGGDKVFYYLKEGCFPGYKSIPNISLLSMFVGLKMNEKELKEVLPIDLKSVPLPPIVI